MPDFLRRNSGVWDWAPAWTNLTLASNHTSATISASDITGLGFSPEASSTYEFIASVGLRTATTTTNPRLGLAWPTGLTDGWGEIREAQTATTELMAFGNHNAALLIAAGGLPNTTQTWPATVRGTIVAGATPSGNLRLQLASETSAVTVTAIAGSWLRYRKLE